jgi:hypothetical protein
MFCATAREYAMVIGRAFGSVDELGSWKRRMTPHLGDLLQVADKLAEKSKVDYPTKIGRA